MRDRPQGQELADLAERARRGDPALALPDNARYRDAMVKRAEAIAARQRETGDAPERREHDALKRLLGGDGDLAALNRALATAIRGGQFDPGTPAAAAVYRHLWETALERVCESNPKALAALSLD
ncbi:MAG: DUF6285 domain-containing protein [Rhodospirillales bacterium]